MRRDGFLGTALFSSIGTVVLAAFFLSEGLWSKKLAPGRQMAPCGIREVSVVHNSQDETLILLDVLKGMRLWMDEKIQLKIQRSGQFHEGTQRQVFITRQHT